jgi:hypothetical protein
MIVLCPVQREGTRSFDYTGFIEVAVGERTGNLAGRCRVVEAGAPARQRAGAVRGERSGSNDPSPIVSSIQSR